MAKATKKKAIPQPNKYDITVKSNLSPDELLRMALNTPKAKQSNKK